MLGIAIAMLVAGLAIGLRWTAQETPQHGDIRLIYVGAEDCAPCRAWQNGDGAAFRKSTMFSRIGYREVKSPRLHDVLEDEYWPEELRAFRSQLKPSDGVPLWLIVSGNQVIARAFGPTAWNTIVLPTLRSRLR